MADSDDEYDRKRRDKFRGERSAGGGDSYRSERRDERRREDWPERNPFRGGRSRPDYREYRGGGRERYSPGRELPPQKRMRPDWGDDGRPRYGGHDGYGMYGWGHEHYPMHGSHGFGGPPMAPYIRGGGGGGGGDAANTDLQTQPAMLTLKQFLDTQDDGISDADVLRKYSEYKLDFKRQQLNEFFVAHKDEEWFKNKYHPEESLKRKEEQLGFLNNRVDVFSELLNQGLITSVTVDTNQSEPLLRLLDTVVIKLEGGTDEDLKALDEKIPDIIIPEKRFIEKKIDDDDVIITDIKKEKDQINIDQIQRRPEVVKSQIPKVEDDENWDDSDDDNKSINKDHISPSKSNDLKRKRSHSESSSSSSSSSDDDSKKDSMENGNNDNILDKDKNKDDDEIKSNNGDDDDEKEDIENKNISKSTIDSVEDEPKDNIVEKNDGNDNITEMTKENDAKNTEEEEEEEEGETTTENERETNIADKEENGTETGDNEKLPETIDLDKEKDSESIITDIVSGPRALHRTSSIFLRNLAPTITKAEIEAVCKRYDGFLRVAIADPLVERRWFRRGWVTLKRDVNIKEICWNLNNIRLRDCEMGAIVNRDLSRRVRPVNGITAHKTIVRNDIKLCAKIVLNLDEKFNLWLNKLIENQGNANNESFGFKSNNPVLQNITDYLIEEASAEEDELLGLSSGENKDTTDGEQLEREPQLISVLDKLILYLRIVHSVDFYNHCEYPYEDEMPNRCGIIHARGPPPQNKITNNDIQDYTKNFDGKMASFLAKSTPIEPDELKNLGCKDPEAEVEKFVQANTQELAKDKWLCPLSGKKFKGPEFIRKHIFNKHGEKVDEVRKEVDYFNNYLKDPKRPQLPEHPGNTKRQPAPDMAPHAPYRGGYAMGGYAPPYAAYAPPMIAPPRNRGFGGGARRGHGGDFRPVIHYRDLDAPREPVDLL